MDIDSSLFGDQVEHVKLGDQVYEVGPQPLPYIKHELGPLLRDLADVDVDVDNLGSFVTGNAHRFLSIFIDGLMPLHRWEGYHSDEDMKAGRFDRDFARTVAPTGPQVRTAIAVAFRVNGLDAVKALRELVDPSLLRGVISKLLIEAMESNSALSPSSSSPAIQASPSETSPTGAPTDGTEPDLPPIAERGSPSPASVSSSS